MKIISLLKKKKRKKENWVWANDLYIFQLKNSCGKLHFQWCSCPKCFYDTVFQGEVCLFFDFDLAPPTAQMKVMQFSRSWKAIGIPHGSLSLRTYTLEVPTRTENTRNQKIKVYNQYSILNIKWILFSTVHFHETDTPHDLTASLTTSSTRAEILMFLSTALHTSPR